MDCQQIFDFLTTGKAERVTGMVFAFLAVFGASAVFAYYFAKILLDFFKRFFDLFKITINRPEKIVKVPEYITPPANKEMDKYLETLKKILKEYDNKDLLP